MADDLIGRLRRAVDGGGAVRLAAHGVSETEAAAKMLTDMRWLAKEAGVSRWDDESLSHNDLAIEVHVRLCRLMGAQGYGRPDPMPKWIAELERRAKP